MQTLDYRPSMGLDLLEAATWCHHATPAKPYLDNDSSSRSTTRSQWLCDTRASHHVCNDKSNFTMLETLSVPLSMETIGNVSLVTQYGSVQILVDGEKGKQLMTLTNVFLVENNPFNIISLHLTRMQDLIMALPKIQQGKSSFWERSLQGR